MIWPCHSYHKFGLVTLTVTFDLHILKFDICHNFSTIRGSAFNFTCTLLVMRPFYSYQIVWPCDLDHDLWPLYLKMQYMPLFNHYRSSFHISHLHSLLWGFSVHTKAFDLVTLTMTFDLHTQKFNICHNFWTIRGRAFTFHMYIPCDEAFTFILKLLTL